MSTVINNPSDSREDSSGVGMIVGIVLAVSLVGLFFLYLLPMIQNLGTPTPNTTEIKVNIPDRPVTEAAPTPAQ